MSKASEQIETRIHELGDGRGETLSRMRELIKEADLDVVEEIKRVTRRTLRFLLALGARG